MTGCRRERFLVLFYPSRDVEGRWVAHCLDIDIIGTGDNLNEAFEELQHSFRMQVKAWVEAIDEGRKPARATAAPKEYWQMAEKAETLPPLDIRDLQEFLNKEYVSPKYKMLDEYKRKLRQCVTRRSAFAPAFASV